MIHEKLDIKILILYILSKLPGGVELGTLNELCGSDDDVGYFDFAECLGELVESGHVEKSASGFAITEKGKRNVSEVSGSLPFSVREKADRALAPVAAALDRLGLIKCSHESGEGGVTVSLSMSDGVGDLIDLKLLCPDEQRAVQMEKNFRAKAEEYYKSISDMLQEK